MPPREMPWCAGYELLVLRASGVLKSQEHSRLAPWETRPPLGARKLALCPGRIICGKIREKGACWDDTPGQGTFFLVVFFLRELPPTKKLEFASAPPGNRTTSSVSWADRALRRKFTSGASATGPVSWRPVKPPSRRADEPPSARTPGN